MRDKATFLAKRLQDRGRIAVWAGGAPRDDLLGLTPKDYDLCTDALPDEIEEEFSDFNVIPTGKQFGVITVVVDEHQFQIATFRADSSESDGRHPNEVRFVKTLKEDAARRDLTINSMFYDPISDQVIDYFDGQADLERGLIRFVGNPQERIQEDRLRILRAARFAVRFGFRLVDEIDVQRSAHLLRDVSRERVREEFEELLIHPNGLKELHRLGLLPFIIPGIESTWGLLGDQDATWHAEGSVWTHSQRVVDELRKFEPNNFELLLAGLLHDIGKPATQCCFGDGRVTNLEHAEVGARMAKNICNHWLKLSKDQTKFVTHLVEMHMFMHRVDKLNHAELTELLEDPFINSMILLQHADAVGRDTKEDKSSQLDFMQFKVKEFEKLPLHQRPSAKSIVSGQDLLDRGFKSGPIFKTILKRARDAQMFGKFDPEDKEVFLDDFLPQFLEIAK